MDQLKDVILSTLAEIQEEETVSKEESLHVNEEAPQRQHKPLQKPQKEMNKEVTEKETFFENTTSFEHSAKSESEILFLESLRERMLVLFEGFQAPNNTALEAKIDLTLNFLEYVLSSIDTRLEQVKGK
jgi:hypothetical protein